MENEWLKFVMYNHLLCVLSFYAVLKSPAVKNALPKNLPINLDSITHKENFQNP